MSHLEEGQLHELLDGELDEDRRKAAEEHLSTCAECRRQYEEAREFMLEADELVATIDLPPAAPSPAPPPAPHAPPVERRPTPRAPAWRTLAWAASLVLAAGLGWFSSEMRNSAPSEAFPTLRDSEAGRDTPATATDATAPKATAPASAALAKDERQDAPARERQVPTAEERKEAPAEIANRAQAPAPTPAPAVAEPSDVLVPRDAVTSQAAGAGSLEQQAPRLARKTVSPAAPAAGRRAAADLAAVGGERLHEVTLDEAVRILGGTIRLLDGLSPARVLTGSGEFTAGADPSVPVVRVVYEDAPSRELWLDQQRLPRAEEASGNRIVLPGRATRLLPGDTLITSLTEGRRSLQWMDQAGIRLTLTGFLQADSLQLLARRVQ